MKTQYSGIFQNSVTLDSYVKPTLRKNNVRTGVHYITGEVEDLKKAVIDKKYDVILAPELVNTKLEYFEEIHDLLDLVLAENGIM